MEKKLKVLHANTGLVAGGAERLISDMLPIMKHKGIDIELMILEDKGNNIFEHSILQNRIPIIKLPFNNKFDIRNIMKIRKAISDFDIVHVHIFPMLYLVAIASIGLKKKPILITTEHNTHNRRRDHKILRYIEKFIYSKYDSIISISPETEIRLLEWLKIKKNSKFLTILNGINIDRFKNAQPSNIGELINKKNNKDDKFLLMVARFDSQKDHGTLFRALTLVPESIKLILVGEGVLEEKYKLLAKELGINNRVFFLGKRTDVETITKSIDVAILSSNWEGFGLVVVEAMAAGKPVIASKVPGVENIVKEYGILFEKGDYRELAKKIVELMNNKKLYNSYVSKSLKRAEYYNIKKMVDEYISLYKNLTNKNNNLNMK